MVKQGDVIAVGIEEDKVRFFAEGKEGADEEIEYVLSMSSSHQY